MTSKSWFFNLLKENLKRRIWSVALSFLVFFFVFPVSAALRAAVTLDPSNLDYTLPPFTALQLAKEQLHRGFLSWHSPNNGFMTFVLLCGAVIVACSGFSYLQSTKKTDFYHSLPISRARLFCVVNLNSVLIAAVPYLLMSLLSAVITQMYSGYTDCIPVALTSFALSMAFFVLLYATVVLAVMLTGHLLICLMGFGLLLFWAPGALSLVNWLKSTWFQTYFYDHSHMMSLLRHSSPLFWCLDLRGFDMTAGPAAPRAGIALLFGALLLLLSLFLYRARRSEAAGHAMAFRPSEAPIRWLLVIPSGLFGALVAGELLQSDFVMVFGMLCGLVISHCMIEIIYHFDFKKLFSHRGQLFLCALLTYGIFAFFRFDLSGYDRYLPAENQVESCGIFSSTLEPNLYSYTADVVLDDPDIASFTTVTNGKSELELIREMRLGNLETPLAVAARGVADSTPVQPSSTEYELLPKEAGQGEAELWGEVMVCWHLKSGRDVLRIYHMNLSSVRKSMDQILDSSEYKHAVYPVLSLQPENIAGVNYEDITGYDHVPVSGSVTPAQLLSVYQRELLSCSANSRRSESPIACLQFKTQEMQQLIDTIKAKHPEYKGYVNDFNRVRYYPVYPSFRETLSLLAACGLKPNAALSPETIASIILYDNRYYYDRYSYDYDYLSSYPPVTTEETASGEAPDEDPDGEAPDTADGGTADQEHLLSPLTVTEPEKIREILQAASGWVTNVNNPLNPDFQGIEIIVQLKNADANPENYGTASGYSLRFSAKDIPLFVKEYFKLTAQDFADNAMPQF